MASGLFYREYTKAAGFTGDTQLAVVHTHLLALGMLTMLIVLALDAALGIDGSRSFSWFFTLWNTGLLLTAAAMTVHGVLQVGGAVEVSAAIPGVAGLGHILLTIATVCLFVALAGPVKRHDQRRRAGELVR
ncbi:MAG: DUF2871 domain-containing protein [Pseudonocardia sp.]|nr:DUF2871 domain-containing protein [Pseudonocardia sp.]